jgi:RNA polymerase sigma factor (sigma-70 family)
MATKTHAFEAQAAHLVAAAAKGDAAAWSALVDGYDPLVRAVARSFRLGTADVEDVSQTVWLRLVEQVARLRKPGSVGAWLATTTRRECLKTLRLSQRQLPFADETVFDREDGGEPLDGRVLRYERNEEIWHAYKTLLRGAGNCFGP